MLVRRIQYTAYNLFVVTMLLLGLVGGVTGALYVGVFIVWFHFVAGLCTLVPGVDEPMRTRGPTVPQWIDVCVELTFVVLLVWHGWFITGAAYLLSAIFMHQAQYGVSKNVVP